MIIDNVHKRFNLSISRNQESPKESACDAVSKAINKVNKEVTHGELIKPTSFNELRQLYFRANKKFGLFVSNKVNK